jgi:hypothetical protein
MKLANKPAFPQLLSDGRVRTGMEGMTLLEYFAGQMMAAEVTAFKDKGWNLGQLAMFAVSDAKALISALEDE